MNSLSQEARVQTNDLRLADREGASALMVGNEHLLTTGRRVARLPGPNSAATKARMIAMPVWSGEFPQAGAESFRLAVLNL